MTNEEAIKHITTWLYAAPGLPPMQVVQALDLVVAALRAGGKDMNVPTIHMTNADRIRAMSDEELADMFAEFAEENPSDDASEWYEWLIKPVEDL